jgi:hypothetical protein
MLPLLQYFSDIYSKYHGHYYICYFINVTRQLVIKKLV